MTRQPNCLNTVRLFAAVLVLAGHVHLNMQVALPAWCVWLVSFFRGVPIFFVLSGFLIWDSVDRSSWREYARKRFLRIYPELWAAVVLGILVMLPLLKVPIQWGQLGAFALTQGTFLQFWTPDFLRGYGCGTPNGSLWTICVTVQFYLLAHPVARWLRERRLWLWLPILLWMILMNIYTPILGKVLPQIGYKLVMQTLIPYGWLFFFGMFLARFSKWLLPWLKKLWPALLLLAAFLKWIGWDIGTHYGIFHCLLMTPGVIGFAYCLPKLNIKWDISYGIYIYHMIFINAMIAMDFEYKPTCFFVVLVVSALLALVSNLTLGNIGSIKNIRKQG